MKLSQSLCCQWVMRSAPTSYRCSSRSVHLLRCLLPPHSSPLSSSPPLYSLLLSPPPLSPPLISTDSAALRATSAAGAERRASSVHTLERRAGGAISAEPGEPVHVDCDTFTPQTLGSNRLRRQKRKEKKKGNVVGSRWKKSLITPRRLPTVPLNARWGPLIG